MPRAIGVMSVSQECELDAQNTKEKRQRKKDKGKKTKEKRQSKNEKNNETNIRCKARGKHYFACSYPVLPLNLYHDKRETTLSSKRYLETTNNLQSTASHKTLGIRKFGGRSKCASESRKGHTRFCYMEE